MRHHRKYAAAPLPHHRWFDFRGPDGAVTATAPDVVTFNRLLQSLDAGIIAYHLERGDFSRWITGVLRDRHLAATASAIERDVLTRPEPRTSSTPANGSVTPSTPATATQPTEETLAGARRDRRWSPACLGHLHGGVDDLLRGELTTVWVESGLTGGLRAAVIPR